MTQTNRGGDLSYTVASRERLLKDPDRICERLNVVDKHMQSYDQQHQSVLLPAGYEFLQPLATVFSRDLGGFASFILDLRNCFDRRSRHFVDIQKVYRRVNGRHVQQSRRERMARAMEKAESMYGPVPYPKRIQWMTDVEHGWAQRRIAFLAAIRKKSGEQHMPTEDRAEALLEFWDIIDTEIYEGKLPPWS